MIWLIVETRAKKCENLLFFWSMGSHEKLLLILTDLYFKKNLSPFFEILLIFAACTLSSSDNRQFFPDVLYLDPDLAVHLLLYLILRMAG